MNKNNLISKIHVDIPAKTVATARTDVGHYTDNTMGYTAYYQNGTSKFVNSSALYRDYTVAAVYNGGDTPSGYEIRYSEVSIWLEIPVDIDNPIQSITITNSAGEIFDGYNRIFPCIDIERDCYVTTDWIEVHSVYDGGPFLMSFDLIKSDNTGEIDATDGYEGLWSYGNLEPDTEYILVTHYNIANSFAYDPYDTLYNMYIIKTLPELVPEEPDEPEDNSIKSYVNLGTEYVLGAVYVNTGTKYVKAISLNINN